MFSVIVYSNGVEDPGEASGEQPVSAERRGQMENQRTPSGADATARSRARGTSPPMDDLNLNDIVTFVRVVEAGSLSAAAERLKMSKSSVSRRIAQIEARLGVRLLQRTSRAVALTGAGRTYFDRVSVGLADILDASSAASDSACRGVVRLSAPVEIGVEVLPDLSQRFLDLYPDISLDLRLSADPPDLLGHSLDLAVVGGPQPDSSNVIRKLRDTDFRLYASPAYLARAGLPQRPEQLADHACILWFDRRSWELTGPAGTVEVAVHGRVTSNSLVFARQAAIAGAGIALLPEIPGALAVRRGLLRPVLPALAMTGSPLYLIYPSTRHLPLRVKLLRDFILEHFPALDHLDGAALE